VYIPCRGDVDEIELIDTAGARLLVAALRRPSGDGASTRGQHFFLDRGAALRLAQTAMLQGLLPHPMRLRRQFWREHNF
jgi:hypothetical protein